MPGTLPRILLAAAEPGNRAELRALLGSWRFAVHVVSNLDELTAYIIPDKSEEIIIIDGRGCAEQALEVCQRIRDKSGLACLHYLLILAEADAGHAAEAFFRGAYCMTVADSFNGDELQARLGPIVQRQQRQLRQGRRLHELTRMHAEMKRELRQVAGLQHRYLPDKAMKIAGIEFDWLFTPAFFVSGDHIGLTQLSASEVAFTIIDVMGHGIASGMRAIELARALSLHPREGILFEEASITGERAIRSPAAVAAILNERFKMTEAAPLYCTLLYGVLNLDTGHGAFVQAGHGGPVHAHKDSYIHTLGGGGFPIGLIDKPNYENVAFQLYPGDRLFLYSDGLTEREDAGELSNVFGEERFLEVLSRGHGSMHEQLNQVEAAIQNWSGPLHIDKTYDDLSILAMRYTGNARSAIAVQAAEPAATDLAPDSQGDVSEYSYARMLNEYERASDLGRLLVVTGPGQNMVLVQDILQDRGFISDLYASDDPYLLTADYSQYKLILVSWIGDVSTQQALVERLRIIRDTAPIYLIAFQFQVAGNGLDALRAGADDFVILPLPMLEMEGRLQASRQWVGRDQVMRRELQRQQVVNDHITQDLRMVEKMQLARFPPQGAIYGNITTGWRYAGHIDASADQLGIVALDDKHIAFFTLHSPSGGILALVTAWFLSRRLYQVLDDDLLYDTNSGQERVAIKAPHRVLQDLNHRLSLRKGLVVHCNMTYGVVNIDTGKGRLAQAGGHAPILRRLGGAIERVGVAAVHLGYQRDSRYETEDFHLRHGDQLFICSSGLLRQKNRAGEALGMERLLDWLAERNSDKTLHQKLTAIEAKRQQWITDINTSHTVSEEASSSLALQFDRPLVFSQVPLNINLLHAPVFLAECQRLGLSPDNKPKSGLQFSANLDLDLPMYLGQQAGEFARSCRFSEVDAYFIDLAIVEAATNIYKHGYDRAPGLIDVWLVEFEGTILLRILDQGCMIPETAVSAARNYEFADDYESADDAPESGMGMPLIFQTMDAVYYHTENGTNILVLVKRASVETDD